MSTYLWIMIAGSVLVFALYGLRCARAERVPVLRKRAWLTALLAFVFSAVFGTVLARAGYALLTQELDLEEGFEALEYLLEFDIDVLSFFCGAVGVILGVALANRLARKGAVFAGLDAFAPFGALLAALFRLGELFFGSYGLGRLLPEGNPLTFFPFSVAISSAGGYEYHAWAVCVLSAAFALFWAGYAFFRLRGFGRTGLNFSAALFFLALTQVFCESLRARGIFWLFVHTEELLCTLVLLGVMLFWILRSGRDLPFPRRWWPLGVLILGAGLLVGVEFAVDGKYFSMPEPVCYLIMAVVLAAIGFAGYAAAKRWNREGSR